MTLTRRKNMNKILRSQFSLIVCLLPALCAGCGQEYTTLEVKHIPLYEATTHVSTISATAKSKSGIKTVELTITKGKMTDRLNLSDPPSVIPFRKNAVTFKKVFNYPSKPKEVTCTYKENFGNQALISYKVKAISTSGDSATSEEITFAAGYPKAAGYQYNPTDIRPVYWHRLKKRDSKIDLCFFPDKDYGGVYTQFTNDIRKIIDYAYFDSAKNNTLSTVYGRTNKQFFNLWAAPFGADKDNICPLCKKTVSAISSVMDGGVIVHNNMSYRDRGTITVGNGFGTVTSPKTLASGSSPPDVLSSTHIFLHESGHFLHGFGDEYCCDGAYYSIAKYPNVFKSETECKKAAKAHGFDIKKCMEINKKGRWHLNQPCEIMGHSQSCGSAEYKFYHFCDLSVLYRFLQCMMGKCY